MQNLLAILLNPIIAILLAIFCIMILFLVVVHSNKNKKTSYLFERIFIVFLLFCASEVGFTPFYHWNLQYLIIPSGRAYLAQAQFVIYFCMALITASRLRWFASSEAISTVKRAFVRDPFIWLLTCMPIASACWSGSPSITLKAGGVFITINLFLTYIARNYDWKELFTLVRWTLALVAFLSIFIHYNGNGEFSGIFFSKNALGSYMGLSIVLWYLHFDFEPKQRIFALVVVALCAVMLFMTKSGGGIFTFLTLISLSIVIRFFKRLRHRTAVVFMMLSIAIVLVLGLFVGTNIETVFGAAGKDITLTGRTVLWAEVWKEIQNQYWLGHGVYSFWQPWRGLSSPAAALYAYRVWQPAQSHQGFLDLWLSSGLIGLTLFIVSFLISLSRSIHYMIFSPRAISILPVIFILYVIMSNISESQLLGTRLIWMLYVLTSVKLTLRSTNREDSGREDSSNLIPFLYEGAHNTEALKAHKS